LSTSCDRRVQASLELLRTSQLSSVQLPDRVESSRLLVQTHWPLYQSRISRCGPRNVIGSAWFALVRSQEARTSGCKCLHVPCAAPTASFLCTYCEYANGPSIIPDPHCALRRATEPVCALTAPIECKPLSNSLLAAVQALISFQLLSTLSQCSPNRLGRSGNCKCHTVDSAM